MKRKISSYISEHEHGLAHLTFLKDAIARVLHKGKNEEDMQIIDDSVSFLTCDLIMHCSKEEIELYPSLKDEIAPELIRKITDEHSVIIEKLKQFEKTMNSLRNDGNIKASFKIKEESDLFIDLLFTHIKEENNLLQTVIRNFKTERKHNENESIRI